MPTFCGDADGLLSTVTEVVVERPLVLALADAYPALLALEPGQYHYGINGLVQGVLLRCLTICPDRLVLQPVGKLLFLPPYSPELNPIERARKLAMRSCTHNLLFADLSELAGRLDRHF